MLGWSEEQKAAEIHAYLERARAESEAILQPDDHSAAEVRARADDHVPMIS
jgi:glycerol-3-phosphate dehydrogenase